MDSLNLELINWRLFDLQKVSLKGENLLITGQNGSGKTSILSALFGLYTGRAWPGSVWKQQIKHGENYFGIQSGDKEWYVSGVISPQGRVITKSLQEIPQEWCYTILTYVPDENRWLTLSRSAKLAILDEALVAVYGKKYLESLQILEKAVATKNRLIRNYQETQQVDTRLVEQMHETIVSHSKILWEYRSSFWKSFETDFTHFESWIGSSLESVTLRVTISMGRHKILGLSIPNFPSSEEVWLFEKTVGRVMFGAQRDDFAFYFNDVPAENFLSRGENRAFLVFFKRHIRSLLTGKVLWLLDDFFNEFDQIREQSAFAELQKEGDWIIATSTRTVDGFASVLEL